MAASAASISSQKIMNLVKVQNQLMSWFVKTELIEFDKDIEIFEELLNKASAVVESEEFLANLSKKAVDLSIQYWQ